MPVDLQPIHVHTPIPRDFALSLPHRYHPVILQYLWNIGLTNSESIDRFFEHDVPHNRDPFLMKDMQKAVDRIFKAIEDAEHILVFGDYDCDGVTSTVVMIKTLRSLGATVDWFVPSRNDGYGINAESVAEAIAENPDIKLIITVDNGIKAGGAATKAKEMGVDLIVTDHHSIPIDPADFPHDAYCVINPQQDDCDYPEVSLAGVGVAFKLAVALATTKDDEVDDLNISDSLESLAILETVESLLYLVAIGTVADMMPLTAYENRWFVQRGIEQMRRKMPIGIAALIGNNKYLKAEEVTVVDIGFGIAPPINASSRVDHPRYAIYMLLAETEAEAQRWANKITELNETRKSMQSDMADEIAARLEEFDTSVEAMPTIIEYLEGCPKGIVGLISGDLSRRYNRFTAIFTDDGHEEGEELVLHGSARSIGAVNANLALTACKEHLITFGGHAMAAGMTLKHEKLTAFKQAMNIIVLRDMADNMRPQFIADIEMKLSNLDFTLLEVIQSLEPIGSNGLPHLSMVTRGVNVIEGSIRFLGKDEKHIAFDVTDGAGNIFECVAWRRGDWIDKIPSKIDVMYKLEKSDFRGRVSLRLNIETIYPAE